MDNIPQRQHTCPKNFPNPFAPKDTRTAHRQSNSPLSPSSPPQQLQQGAVIDSIPQRQHTCPKKFPSPFAPKDTRTAHRQSNSPLSPTSPPLAPPAPARSSNRQREHPKDNLLTGRLIPRQSIPSRPLHIGHTERGLANMPRRANRTRYVRPHHLT